MAVAVSPPSLPKPVLNPPKSPQPLKSSKAPLLLPLQSNFAKLLLLVPATPQMGLPLLPMLLHNKPMMGLSLKSNPPLKGGS